jgi:hypothetical protein
MPGFDEMIGPETVSMADFERVVPREILQAAGHFDFTARIKAAAADDPVSVLFVGRAPNPVYMLDTAIAKRNVDQVKALLTLGAQTDLQVCDVYLERDREAFEL